MKKGQKGKSTWYERAYALTNLDDTKPDEFFELGKRPKWFVKVKIALTSQAMPTIPVKQLWTVTPNKVGRFWGQKFANLYVFGGKSNVPENPQKIQKAIDHWLGRKNEPGALDVIRQLEMLKRSFQTLANNFGKLEQNALKVFKMALEQPQYEEAVEFFKGFAAGISKQGMVSKNLAGETDATPIYKMILAHWREVDRLSSVPQLREFLINHGMPDQVVGDISRLRRLCTRIGYAPGKRGRPLKPEK